MNTIFKSAGLAISGRHYGALALQKEEVGGWLCTSLAHSMELLDVATGLSPSSPGEITWFGQDISGMDDAEILRFLRRITVLTRDGGLIENLNIAENILLPYLHRHRGDEAGGMSALGTLMKDSPAGRHLGRAALGRLPHQIGFGDRALAGVLRAHLLQPEVIVACDVMFSLDRSARIRLDESLAGLRSACPGAAWLFIQTGSVLPARMEGRMIGEAP